MANNISQKIYDDAITELLELCKTPHTSNEVEKPNYKDHNIPYRNYLSKRIKSFFSGAKINQDGAGNMWFDVPASPDCKDFKKIILQAHFDMVWDAQKEATKWNKRTHPVSKPVIEKIKGEEVMHSYKYLTSLGADDGEGVALILSLVKNRDNFKHGAFRCLLTADEEPGLYGVRQLGICKGKNVNVIKGFDYLANIDTPLLDTIITSSAGGNTFVWTVNKFTIDNTKQSAYKLRIFGGHGGHSADQIDDGFANTLKLVNTILLKIGDVRLASYTTPNTEVNNKIPKESEAVFVSKRSYQEINKIVTTLFKQFKKQYPVDKGLKVSFTKTVSTKCMKNVNDSKHILDFVDTLPYGPLSHFKDDGFVESSSNVSPIELDLSKPKEQLIVQTYSRSANLKKLVALHKLVIGAFKKHLANNFKGSSYKEMSYNNPWEYNKINPLRDLCIASYKKIGRKPKVYKVHCCIECSYFIKANPKIYQVSIGAQTDFEHNVRETLHLKSYKNLAAVMLNVLSNLKK